MEKFYLGMDIGTDSVGMACTDENYTLLRAHGCNLWSVRLFDEAKDATDRRTKRSARRRLQRRRRRIEFLQEVFAEVVDPALFFIRLNNSGFCFEDKEEDLNSKYALFDDAGFTDKEFYDKYPTIYHLRSALLHSQSKEDWRLYYLALHHIIKYRGHFLFEGQDLSSIRNFGELLKTFNEVYGDIFEGSGEFFPLDKSGEIARIIVDSERLKDKTKKLLEIINCGDDRGKAVITMMLGGKVKLDVLFEGNYDESISLKGMSEEEFESKQSLLGEDFGLLVAIKNIYNYGVLEKLLCGNDDISSAMIEIYEKHHADLKLLKSFIRENCPRAVYFKVFRSREKGSYSSYIGYTKTKREKVKVKKCAPDEFFKFLKKAIAEHNDKFDEDIYNKILVEIEAGNFLPKIINADNGIFPYQINLFELDGILKNLCRDYPLFGAADDSGLSAADKIRKIFLFKIPYYVGPLNNYHEDKGGNSWVVRKSGKITPWNFDEMINFSASNEKFIRRMTNKCSYLIGKDVLPKNSIIYQKFDTLNQINKLKINETPITPQLKQYIFNDLFLKHRKVTVKMIKTYLVNQGLVAPTDIKDTVIGGFNEDIKASMSSYVLLKSILGDYADTHLDVCENIILWHTLNTDKRIVEKQIIEKYGNEAAVMSNIKRLKGLSFKDFGRLSEEFLCKLSGGKNEVTGADYTILGELYNTNKNLNEIIYDPGYCFEKAIKEYNGQLSEQIEYSDVENLYVSPKVRRGVWQALLMVDEYVEAVGKAPDKIFIEVTRGDGKKEQTKSRKTMLTELYSACKKDIKEIGGLLEELNKKSDLDLRSERLYLYFTQLGKCMYTGQRINLEELTTDLYDVDHIIPRSLTKDDSLDNKVLVLRTKNKAKSDTYPLESGFTDCEAFWKLLRSKELISDKKLARLCRKEPLTADDFNDFINRQLVETNQTVKAVRDLLERKFASNGTRIVLSKAKFVTDFKERYNIVKCREVNDLHHAKDAYLNIVVGNVYDTKFTCAYDYFYKKGAEFREYNLKKLFDYDIKGAWNAQKSLSEVKSTLCKTGSIKLTKYAYMSKDKFYDETVYSKGDGGIAMPRKNKFPYTQTDKYGGFSSLTTAYFAIVRSKDKKGNIIKTIERIPVIVDYSPEVKVKEQQAVLDYLAHNVGLIEPELIVPMLKIKTLVSINGFRAYLAGVTGNYILLHNAVQWLTDAATEDYVKQLTKLCEQEDSDSETYNMKTNRFGNNKLTIDKDNNLKLYDAIIAQLEKKIYRGVSATDNFLNKLKNKRDVFAALKVFEQAKVLLQCIKFLQCKGLESDLSLLGEGAHCGKILINKNITSTEFAVKFTSPCGLKTKEFEV